MKAAITLILLTLHLSLFAQEIIHLEMKSLRYKPIIEAEINGKKAYFLVDTGSDISILDRSILRAYNIEEIKPANRNKKAIGFNGAIADVKRVKHADIMFGSSFKHNTFYSLNLESLSQSIKKKTDFLISGIIGADILIKYNCIIDYEQRQITLISKRLNHQLALTK